MSIERIRRKILNIGKTKDKMIEISKKKDLIDQEKKINEDKNTDLLENNVLDKRYKLYDSVENDILKHKLKIGFLIVATGKYDIFINPLIRSIEKYVLPNNSKFYNIFSDREIILEGVDYSIFSIEHRPFPYPTLKRFHFFEKYKNDIKGDQLIYIDADTLVTDNIGTEILYPVTVTQHCGFVNMVGSFEKRKESKCYINPENCKNYIGGGFYSFSRENFFKMSDFCRDLIDCDEENGIIPIWHDETAINKYISTIIPDRVLSPSFHYPENNERIYNFWGGKHTFKCKILLLDKNHKEIRS
jgi:hypothetical protein